MLALKKPQIKDVELIYNIWNSNGTIYGPYDADSVFMYYTKGMLVFPTRIQISEARKKGSPPILNYFGSIDDLQDMFGIHNFLPKRLSQFRGKWPLPDIKPNKALFPADSIYSFPIPNLGKMTILNYCPFVTGAWDDIPEEDILPLSSVLELAKRILIEYSNLSPEERQYFYALLSEVFTPSICSVCDKIMDDQHAYLIHALSVVHLENAVIRSQKKFTCERDYLRLRTMLDDVKEYMFAIKLIAEVRPTFTSNQQMMNIGWFQPNVHPIQVPTVPFSYS